MSTKECRACGNERALSDFYSGHATCKSCYRAKVAARRDANIEKVREYDRQRGLLPSRKARVKANAWKYQHRGAEDRARNPEKYAARTAVGNALRVGVLVKPLACESCGHDVLLLHAHHDDYSKPIDVRWLCPACHGAWHRAENDRLRNPGIEWKEAA